MKSNDQPLESTTQLIPSLDGWRAIAILGVIACHSTGFLFPHPEQKTGFLYLIFYFGTYGVDLFFGISGFLICSRLIDSERARGKVNFTHFYIRRFFRILPPYLLYLAFIALLKWINWLDISPRNIWSCLVFFPNYLLGKTEISWYFGHFWTLAVEEHYYLIFPAAFAFLGKSSKRRFFIFFASGLLIAAWRVLEFRLQLFTRILPDIGFYSRTDIRLDGLIFGAIAAIFWRSEYYAKYAQNQFRLLQSEALCWAFILLLICSITLTPPLSMLWQALLIPAILLCTTLNPNSYLSRFLSTQLLQWVGRLSYSLYIWNNFFLLPEKQMPIPQLQTLQTAPYNYLALLSIAVLCHYLVERPFIRLGRRLSE